MHVVPINVLEHRLSIQSVEQWLLKQRVEHKLLKSTCEASTPKSTCRAWALKSTWYEWLTFNRAWAPKFMSMHGLNDLINNNVQLPRLNTINNNDNINNNVRQHQHYNLINIHHLIATSYNHHITSHISYFINIYTYLHVIFHLSSYS